MNATTPNPVSGVWCQARAYPAASARSACSHTPFHVNNCIYLHLLFKHICSENLLNVVAIKGCCCWYFVMLLKVFRLAARETSGLLVGNWLTHRGLNKVWDEIFNGSFKMFLLVLYAKSWPQVCILILIIHILHITFPVTYYSKFHNIGFTNVNH